MVRVSLLPAPGFPAAAKSQNPFLADLNRAWLTCFHISQEQGEGEKRSLFSRQQRNCGRLQYAAFQQRHRARVWKPLANYLLSPSTRSESWSCWTESFPSLHTDHILRSEWQSPPAALEETPALPTSAAALARPVGCRLLICTSESVRLHTRDLRDNEGFVLHLRIMDFTKTTQTERKNWPKCFPKPDSYIFFPGYETGVRFHERDN